MVVAMDVDADKNGLSAVDAGDQRYSYHDGPRGTVVGLTDQPGKLREGYVHGPYGNVSTLTPGADEESI